MTGTIVATSFLDRLFGEPSLEPMTVHVELVLCERLDLTLLAEAVVAVQRRHPMLRARRAPGGASWIIGPVDDPVVPELVVASERSMGRARGRAVSVSFDLDREPPLRVTVVRTERADHLIAVADHAAIDGIGIRQVALSLLSRYHEPVAQGEDDAWRAALEFDPPSVCSGSNGDPRQYRRPPTRPTAVRLARSCDRPVRGSGVVHHDLGVAARLRLEAATSPGTTTNDVLLAAFASATMTWNLEHEGQVGPVAIGVPVNLRPFASWTQGVCNATLLWPIRLTPDDPQPIVERVAEQTKPHRRGRYNPEVAALVLDFASRPTLPLWARHSLGSSTTVVSTVPARTRSRDELRPGSVDRFYGGAPASSSMPLTFAVVPGTEHLAIVARYLRSHHAAGAVHEFLLDVERSIERMPAS